jgi:hypothetical protein
VHQQGLVRGEQRVGAVGGAVEAGGDGGDLVAAVDQRPAPMVSR